MISIGEILVLTVFARSFAPLTLGSYCTIPVSQVTLARTLSWSSVFGKGLLSLVRGHVLITHCDIGPDRERTHPRSRVTVIGKRFNLCWKNDQ